MNRFACCAVLLTAVGPVLSQAAPRPAPTVRAGAKDVARLRGTSTDNIRMPRDGVVNAFEVSDTAPVAAELLVLGPGSGQRAAGRSAAEEVHHPAVQVRGR